MTTNETMNDRTHVMTIRVSELTFSILQAREAVDGRAAATRAADLLEEIADKERHASNLIQRAIESEQAPVSASKPQ